MCLGVPSKVVSIDEGHFTGEIDVMGNIKKVSMILVPGAQVGDWVLIHAGQAISVISDEEADASLAVWEELIHGYQA